MRKIFLSLLICVLFASPALAAMSDEDFIELSLRGTLQQIQEAIRNGANVNARERLGDSIITPLNRAAAGNLNPEVIRVLIEAGADVNERGAFECTPLFSAIYNPNLEVMIALIEAGADVNARNAFGRTPLLEAIKATYLEVAILTILVNAGADVNARTDFFEMTALMMASLWDPNPEVITTLLNLGADPKIKNVDGRMAIDLARENEALRDTDALRKLYDLSF